MDLNVVLKSLQTQHEEKVKQIQQLQQALEKTNVEALKLQGAWEMTSNLIESDKKETESKAQQEVPTQKVVEPVGVDPE